MLKRLWKTYVDLMTYGRFKRRYKTVVARFARDVYTFVLTGEKPFWFERRLQFLSWWEHELVDRCHCSPASFWDISLSGKLARSCDVRIEPLKGVPTYYAENFYDGLSEHVDKVKTLGRRTALAKLVPA